MNSLLSHAHTLRRVLVLTLWLSVPASAVFSDLPSKPVYPAGFAVGLNTDEIFAEANEAYRQNELEKALAGYRYLADLGTRNGYLFYNLGNTHFRLGELGESVLWYERALRYLPRFRDLRVNYEYVRTQLTDEEFEQPERSGTIGFLMDLHDRFNLRESLRLSVLQGWLLALALAPALWIRREPWRSRVRIPCWILGILFIITLLSTGFKAYRYEVRVEAVVMSSAVDIKTAPSPEFSTSFTLHEGTKVVVVQEQGDWVHISLPGNPAFSGWMPRSGIQVI